MENEKTRTGDGLEAFRKWLTPLLIVVAGYLIGKKMDDIDKKLELVNALQIVSTVQTNELNNVKARLEKLETKLEAQDKTQSEQLYREAEKNIKKLIR